MELKRLIDRLPAPLRRQLPRQVGTVQLRPTEAQERRQSAQDRLPWTHVEPGIIWLKAHLPYRAMAILEVLPINFKLRSPFERRQILRAYTEALNSLKHPVEMRNHAERLDLTGYIGGLRETAQATANPIRRAHLEEHAEFITRLTHDKALVRRRFFLTLPYVGFTANPTPAEIRQSLLGNAQDLSERLQRCGLTVHPLGSVDIANHLHALLRPHVAIEQQITDEDLSRDTLLNLVAPDALDFGIDHTLIGDRLSRTLMVTHYRAEVQEGWLSDLYSYSPDVAVIQHLEPTTAETLQREISNSLGEIEHQLNKGGLSALEVKQKQLQQASADYLLSQLASGSQEVLDFSMYLQIAASSKAELDAATTKLERMLGGAGMRTRRPRYQSHQGFDTAMPGCWNRLKPATAWQLPAESVASTFPFDHAELSHATGILRGINKFTRNAVILDSYHPSLVNQHEVSIMTSGAGKTVEMKTNLDRSIKVANERAFVLDIEREYYGWCQAHAGQWINLAPGAGHIINPLEIRPPARMPADAAMERDIVESTAQGLRPPVEHASHLLAGIQRQQTLWGLILPGLTETTLAFAEEAQYRTYLEAGIDEHLDLSILTPRDWPHIGHLIPKLAANPHTEELGMCLRRWWDGALRGLIGGHTTVDLDSQLVLFDIHDLEGMPRAQPSVLFVALAYLWDEIRRDRMERKVLAIDELGLLKENPQALWFGWMISKRARKYSCRLKVATQQVADFVSAGPYAEAILNNAETKILGRQKEGDLAALRQLISFSEQEVDLLAKMPATEKLMLVGTQRVLVEVETSKEELRRIDYIAYLKRYEAEEYERRRRQGAMR